MRVTIIDDTLRRTLAVKVTDEMRLEAIKIGKPIPSTVKFLLAADRQGRRVQETVRVKKVFEGEVLTRAVRRAKRWMRGPRFNAEGAPRHIALAMAAFHKADPKGFAELRPS